jgi:hypothetical protein
MNFPDFVTNVAFTLRSIVKIALQSRCATLKPTAQAGSLIIMGNGPSLNDTINNNAEQLAQHPLLAVNFAANAPQFATLRPQYYVLVDPFFFSGNGADNLAKLWANLAAVDWQMTIIVPVKFENSLPQPVVCNENIIVKTINCVGVEGFKWLETAAYKHGMAMPRPRNVLIPAVMAGIWLGYKEINIVGADHSWMQSIWVDDDNNVVSVQPHFYKDDAKEQKRVDSEYKGYRLHQIINSFYVAFKSYHNIERFARSQGVKIYNATRGSFIDAFERRYF